MNDNLVLEMRNIDKSFFGVKVLDNACLNAYAGKVVALMGENGAGKSTLMKILSGVYSKDNGAIVFNNEKVVYNNPHKAYEAGISIIHQELNLFSNLSIWENIFLGRELKSGFRLDKVKMISETSDLLRKVGLDIKATVLVEELSIGQQQLIEIAKALSFNSRVIIFDEPTSSLSLSETQRLFEIIKDLKSQNVAIIYISHRMEEIFAISDKVIILRDGSYIDEVDTCKVDENKIIELMVGRKLSEQYPKIAQEQGNKILTVKNLTSEHFKEQSFDIYSGEIVVFTGLVGSGRTEIAHTLYGLSQIKSGEICLDGKKIETRSTRKAINLGIKYVSEDRKGDGLILDMSIKHNITISNLENYVNFGLQIDHKKESTAVSRMCESLKVKMSFINDEVGYLSGGNQQKVAFARILEGKTRLLILDEPTRGVDVGAKVEIYNLINSFKQKGIGIMVISSDMEEVLGIADRIVVMANKKITAFLDPKLTSSEEIMKYAIDYEGKYN